VRSPDGLTISVVRHLNDDDVRAVETLAVAATLADGVGPLSEHVRLHLKYGGDSDAWHLIARRVLPDQPSELIGYAHLDKTDLVEGPSAELVVAPSARQRGVGGALLDSLSLKLSKKRGDGPLRLWAHGALPGAAALAASRNLELFRELWLMVRPLNGSDAIELPAVPEVEGVELRAFRPGVDDAAWLDLNARAFAHHPEQGGITAGDLEQRISESWFDPAGFFLAWRGEKLAGFHWTKIHAHGAGIAGESEHSHDPIGEVYVVGVDPGEQGNGLGRVLTLVGLHHLRDKGLAEVLLYVDADNVSAVHVYKRLGFVRRSADVMYRAAT
jgi:mycothiol synthase